jgi:four helix bundle protein
MNEKAEALKKRTKTFALDVLTFVRALPSSDEAKVVVAANYRATCRSRSQAEFVARIGVALEEPDESAFWLAVIVERKIAAGKTAADLLDEADQLSAILAASSITAAEKLNRGETP